MLFLGDNFLREGIVPQVQAFRDGAMNAQIILYPMDDPSSMGVAVLDGDGRVTRLVEKPKQFISPYAVIGIYMFDQHVFEAVNSIKPSARGELEITETIQYLIDHGFNVRRAAADRLVDRYRQDLGHSGSQPPDPRHPRNQDRRTGRRATRALKAAWCWSRARVVINSTVRGPAIIGAQTRIENAYVGPYTSIQHDCVVQNCEIEHSVVLENTRILDVSARIADSLIGRNVEIGRAGGQNKALKIMLGDYSKVGILRPKTPVSDTGVFFDSALIMGYTHLT